MTRHDRAVAAPLRVLVVEDSPTARALLVAMLDGDPGIQVVGEAATGDEAVAMAERLHPDLITMDVHMPGSDGLSATRAIMAQLPTPIIIVSALAADDVRLSLEATRAGALMVLPKPTGPADPGFERQRAQLVSMVKAMAQVKVVRRWTPGRPGEARPTPPRPGHAALGVAGVPAGASPGASPGARAGAAAEVRLVAIAASTGGPAALRDVLAALPARFPVPVLVVQHIASGFVGGLAQWLGGETALRVVVAEHGMAAERGTVYLAPDDRHLGVERRAVGFAAGGLRLVLDDAPPVGAFRPSGSWLFESAARALGGGVLAVILTGMGDDGVSGLRLVHALGGRVLAQDERSSVVYGMPREAARAGVVDAVLPLAGIAGRLIELTERGGDG